MATRAATFTAKIRNLKDYHYRMANNMSPLPSGVDIANTLKYFSQTLLSVLKDVPIIPSESYGPRQRDSVRLSVFPNLNYSGLYEAVMSIIDVVSMVQYGQHALGEAILNVFGCLVPFLEYDLLDTLPYTVSTTLAIFPATLHKDIIELLCTNLIPVTLGYAGMNDKPTYATDSAAAIIMLVLQYVDKGEYHSHVIECIMSMKKHVFKDLLSVIAYGPPASKAPAVNHLFHYWPQLNPSLTDRRGIHSKYLAWQPVICQRENCPNSGSAKAVKMCLDAAVAIQCGDRPPPLYVCVDCVDQLRHEHAQFLVEVLRPLEKVPVVCENKNCTSPKNLAVCTCFSIECASFNGYKPIRYCATCHNIKHGSEQGTSHVFHMTVPDVWTCEADMQGYLVEAIVSLLKEAQPMEEKRVVEMGEERTRHQHFEDDEEQESEVVDERKLLSRYGIWLMVEVCKPKEDIHDIPIEILGRILAMLFQWFDATAYLPDDNVGNALERLKPEYIYKWLQEVSKTHHEVILSCLLPHPVEYARVGGHWDTLSSRTSQIKEGLNRLFCLVPYDIVTFEVWDYVIPFWLEAIRTEVPEEDRRDLKVLLCKAFDIDMCSLPFSVDKMYYFVMERFEGTTAAVQEQNLAWLQILSSLEILVPLDLMLTMFKTGVSSLAGPPRSDPGPALQGAVPLHVPLDDIMPGSPLTPSQTDQGGTTFVFGDNHAAEDSVPNLTCFIMMLDLLIKQVELQDAPPHVGIYNDTSKSIMALLTLMLSAPWEGTHTCYEDEDVTDCSLCEMAALWHQLEAQVVEFMAPLEAIHIPEKDLPKVEEISHRHNTDSDHSKEPPIPEEAEKLFDMSNLPIHLHLLQAILRELDNQSDADALFYLLKTLKLMCLHAECLNLSLDEYPDFISHTLKTLMMPNLWKLLQSEHSQLAVVGVPIMLHCLTLPTGSDIFWHLVEQDFCNDDWRARFSAVEKVTMIARLIDPDTIKTNQPIMTALAHAFCYLVSCLNDINTAVTQRTITYLETIKGSSLRVLCQCLEFQFDSVISDRTMILQRLMLLQRILMDQDIFTWEFFLNRFDTLCLEAQLDLESSGEVAALTDLHSSDRQSDHFLRKINRARFALARTDSIRSVSGSICAKPPYRRAASVPLHLLAKTTASGTKDPTQVDDISELKPFLELLIQQEKDKSYTRQQSAPQFTLGRRDPRGSRFGLGMFSNYMFPGGNLREFTDEESNFAALLQRAMDLEGVDRETVHLLVSLLLKYMVHSDQDRVNDDRNWSRAQNIVLRHLNVLLGYNQTEKAFSVPPYKLRYSPVFNAFLFGLPVVLDKNFPLGNIILPVSMSLLQYCCSPQRYASDYQPPNYTLWYLEPHARQSWLMALLVILYKYQYNSSLAAPTIQTLIRITVNTIEAQLHRCRRHDDTFGPHSPVVPRNRDTSNVSVGDLENIQETDTPPQSPTDSQHSAGDTVTITMTTPSTTTVHYKRKADSEKTEETDVESLSPTSKVASPTSKVTSPSSPSKVASPQVPSSPISAPGSPGHLPFALGRPSKNMSPTKLGSPTEEIAKLQKEQPRRIAEYNAGSLPEVRELSSPTPSQGKEHTGQEKSQVNLSQKRSPFKQRTLEQSVEEFMMQQVGLSPKSTTPLQSPQRSPQKSPLRSPQKSPQRSPISPASGPSESVSVEKKMAEQILAFESESEAKKKSSPSNSMDSSRSGHGMSLESLTVVVNGFKAPSVSADDQVIGEEHEMEVLIEGKAVSQSPHKSAEVSPESSSNESSKSNGSDQVFKDGKGKLAGQGSRPLGPLGERPVPDSPTQLYSPEIKVTSVSIPEDGEISADSPRRLPRAPLGKTHSAGVVEGSDQGKCDPEFVGAKKRTERAMSEKTSTMAETMFGGRSEGEDEAHAESDGDESPSPTPTPKMKPHYRQRKARRTGLTAVELQKMIPELGDGGRDSQKSPPPRRSRKAELIGKLQASVAGPAKRSLAALRLGEHVQVERCAECGAVLEQYDEDTVSLAIVCLATFIHREAALAAPMLLDMLQAAARIASSSPYPWQSEISGLIIPGNCVSVARQFMRCVLHQLAPNGIFCQLFITELEDPEFLKTMASSLVDFNDLNCYSALQLVLEGVNAQKVLTGEQVVCFVANLSAYLDCIALETSSPNWNAILLQFDTLFRRLPVLLPNPSDMSPILKIMTAVLKIPGLTSVKGILEPFSKLLSFTLQNCSFKLQQILDICSLCSRAFMKERDKLYLTRSIILELVQAIKFRTSLPDENLLKLVQFVVMDSGGTLGPTAISKELSETTYNPYTQCLSSTNAAECMKQHLAECVEFITDLHTITRVKSNVKTTTQNLNEDTLGGQLKAGIAQYLALEFTRGNGRDNRAINRYLPWLYHPPSAMQQGPREFLDCISHIRLLSWLLLGSLTHTALTKSAETGFGCQPIPLEANSHVADHVMVIMTGFAEQSKASVLHMSSLFHAFILCQLWTMYCESFAAMNSPLSEQHIHAHVTVMDFWGRVTPGVLQLLSHSKVLAEMVNLHFLSLMEALQECRSTVLSKLYPLWTPILFSYHSQLPGHMQVRLQMCSNWEPWELTEETGYDVDSATLLKWLKRLQFKLAQIELQSSAANQFYTV